MCDVFKDCRKTFDDKRSKNRSQIKKIFTKTKTMHAATLFENNMSSEMEVTSYSKGKGKIFLRWCAFMLFFMGLNFEIDKPRMNPKLRVMMAEL